MKDNEDFDINDISENPYDEYEEPSFENNNMKIVVAVLITLSVALSLPLGAYDKIKDYLSITTGAVETRILNGDLDPSVSGVAAPIGSEYLRDNGDSFKKVGSFDVDWIRQLNTSTPIGLELMEDPSFEKSVSSYCVSDNTAPFITSNTSLKSPNNKKGTRINLRESGVTNYTCTIPVSAAYEGTPIRHKGWLTLWSAGNFSCSIVAQWNGADVGNAQIITSSQNIYYDLEVVPTGAGTTGFKLSCDNSTADTTYFVIHDETSNKAEKISPVVADVKRTQSETLLNVGNLTQTTNLASFAVEDDSLVRGIYTKSAAGLTFHQDADVIITYGQFRSTSGQPEAYIYVNGVSRNVARPAAGMNTHTRAILVRKLKAGDIVTFSGNSGDSSISTNTVEISATATSPTIVMQNETFNSDLHLGAWVAQPNTGTCSSVVIEGEANVGKWTTCSQITANSTAVTGCTTRPTQTDAEAKTQGVAIYTRNYATARPCTAPTEFFFNLGKNYKTPDPVNIYKAVNRQEVEFLATFFTLDGNSQYGAQIRSYNPATGILRVSGGVVGNYTTGVFRFGSGSQSYGYLVISASKNPAMSGVNAPAMQIVKHKLDTFPKYKIYDNCWVEQENYQTSLGTAVQDFTLPIAMASTNYIAKIDLIRSSAIALNSPAYSALSASVLRIITDGANANSSDRVWEVRGMASKTALQALGVDTSKCQ